MYVWQKQFQPHSITSTHSSQPVQVTVYGQAALEAWPSIRGGGMAGGMLEYRNIVIRNYYSETGLTIQMLINVGKLSWIKIVK